MSGKDDEREPTTTLTVPAKPVAVSAANVLGLAATGIATGGVGAVIGAAGLVAAPVAVYGARRLHQRWQGRQQASRALRTATTRSSIPALPKLGGSRSPKSSRSAFGSAGGSRSGNGRSVASRLGLGAPVSRASRTGKSPLAGGTTPRGSRTGGLGGLFSRSNRRGGGPQIGGLPGRPNRGGGSGGSSARWPSSRVGRAAHRFDRGLGAVGRGIGSTFGGTRGTKNPARAAAAAGKAHKKAGGSNTGALLAGLGSGVLTVGKGLGWVMSWPFRYAIRRRRRGALDRATSKAEKRQLREVRDRVTRAPKQKRGAVIRPGTQVRVQARPGQAVQAPGTTMGRNTMGNFREMSGQMWTAAAVWQPRGMLAAVHEFDDLPDTVGYMRATVGVLMEKAQKRFPVDPVIAQQLAQIVQTLDAAANMAKKVPEAIHTIHDKELARLDHRARAGESMWDRSANGIGG